MRWSWGAEPDLAACARAGYEHPVDQVVEDLLSCLDDPALALLQWNEAFGVVQARARLYAPSQHPHAC